MSRILLPAGVGKVAGTQNLVSYFVILATLGLPSYGVREFAKVRENSERKDTLFTELFIINLISTTISIVAYAVLLIWNNGFNNEWALYICCGLTILFNYLNIDWIYQGLEEYGYITGRSIAIKIVSWQPELYSDTAVIQLYNSGVGKVLKLSKIRNKCKQYNCAGSQKKYGAVQFWTSPKGHLTRAELVEFDEKGSEINRTSLYKHNAKAIPFVA